MPGATSRVDAIVVDFHAGPSLHACVESLLGEGLEPTVVDNAVPSVSASSLAELASRAHIVATGANLGYGGGMNRGVAATSGELLLICNPDIVVHPGAVEALVATFDAHPEWGIVAPTILTPEGAVYPSIRRFPGSLDAAGHALLGQVWPQNPFTVRYLTPQRGEDAWGVDWVSGACFMVRRHCFEMIGGFDEAFFMFAEDLDLCRRIHEAGLGIGLAPKAVVTHVEGVSRRRRPYRMLVAHHRSALRYQAKTAKGWRQALLPLAAAVLGARLVLALCLELLGRRSPQG